MFQFVPPSNAINKNKQKVIYWKVTFTFPQMNPLEFKVRSIKEFSKITGIKDITLRKIVYDKKYHSKKYDTALKYMTIEPVYAPSFVE